ncbi:Burkholderia phage Bcep781 gp38 [Acetobacter senegalensis]|uniref:Burkholderia phage Bcep781 gp38 n=1 Tax=Acetobacter senegalensis TaxID=446692 RepID=A0A0U5ETV5_9PROT|nr:Burkholderia phage Bcep781 gp38 [Acetobacter senegalensis]
MRNARDVKEPDWAMNMPTVFEEAGRAEALHHA